MHKTIDINEFTINRNVELLRPENIEIREQIDIGYSYDRKVAILYQIRLDWKDQKRKINLTLLKFGITNQKKNGIYLG